jgi:pilus assembly protein Flp/PilA
MMRPTAQDPSRAVVLLRFLDDESGLSAVEYGLMAALISVTIMGAVGATGQAIRDTLYGQIVNALASMTK